MEQHATKNLQLPMLLFDLSYQHLRDEHLRERLLGLSLLRGEKGSWHLDHPLSFFVFLLFDLHPDHEMPLPEQHWQLLFL
jgi:hypothetical protein